MLRPKHMVEEDVWEMLGVAERNCGYEIILVVNYSTESTGKKSL